MNSLKSGFTSPLTIAIDIIVYGIADGAGVGFYPVIPFNPKLIGIVRVIGIFTNLHIFALSIIMPTSWAFILVNFPKVHTMALYTKLRFLPALIILPV
jgi:hypothetical protein